MTSIEVRKAAFEYERSNPTASPSVAFIQGYMHKENEQQSNVTIDTPEITRDNDLFATVWKLYDRKDNKQNAIKAWRKLSAKEKQRVLIHVPPFVKAHPDKQYRPMLATYLNQKRFNDEELIYNAEPTDQTKQRLSSYAEAIANFK